MRRSILLFVILWQTLPVLSEPIRVGGLVTTPEGHPVAAARAELAPLTDSFQRAMTMLEKGRDSEPVAVARSDAEGRFLLTAPGPGVWTVVVRAEGRMPMRYFPLPLVSSVELAPVRLLKDEGVHIELAGGVDTAEVWVMATCSDGDFWRPQSARGWQADVRLGRGGAGDVYLARARGEPLDLHLLRPGRLPRTIPAPDSGKARLSGEGSPSQGRQWIEVADPLGERLAGVVVANADLGWPLGRTGEDGDLSLDGVESLPLSLVLLAADGSSATVELQPAVGDGDGPVRLILPPAQSAAGRVVDRRDSRPVAGALVWPGHDPGGFDLTDAEGRYKFPAPADKRFWLQAEAAGYLPRIGGIGTDVLELIAASELAGEVADTGGRPLSGVQLSAEVARSGKHPRALRLDAAVTRSLSDGQGRFLLRGLAAGGSYQLTVAKPGFVTVKVPVEVSPPEHRRPLRVVLERVRVASGRVVDVDESPIAKVAVLITATGETRRRRARPLLTDATGRFELAHKLPPVVDLEALKQGFAPLAVRGVEIPPGEGPIDLGTLVLVAGAKLHGRVAEPDGEPIAGASVWIDEDGGPTRPAPELLRAGEPATETDAQGLFRIEDLPPRQKVHLAFGHEEYLSTEVLGVELPHPDPIEVTLEPGAALRGRVMNEDDEAIVGARVRARPRQPAPGTVAVIANDAGESKSVRTGAFGEFVISGMAAGEMEVEAAASGFQPSSPLAVEVPDGGSVDGLELVLARAAVIHGRVTDRWDEPIAEALVLLPRSSARTNAEGWYRLDQAPPGLLTVEVRHLGYRSLTRQLEVEPGENVADFVLDGGLGVTGHVVDESGAPVPGAGVGLRLRGLGDARSYRTNADAGGLFEFPAVVSGRYDLEAEGEGYGAVTLEDHVVVHGAPVEGIVVELPGSVSVSGRLVGLSFEELSAANVVAESGERSLAGSVDYDGGYRIVDLGPGAWLLKAWLRGGSRQAQARLVIEPGVRQVERDLEFGDGLTLTGTVVYGDAPLSGTTVTLTAVAASVQRSVATDRDGGFRLEDLEAGSYHLALDNARELITHYQEVELSADRHLDIEIATVRLRGRVVSAETSEPIAGAQVTVQRMLGPDGTQPGPVVGLVAGPEGTFEVERAAAGWQRLTARKAGYAPGEETLELRSGDEVTVELSLSPTAGLELVVSLASGARPSYAAVIVHDPSGRPVTSESARVVDDGHARFHTVPPGTWDLLVTAPGGAVKRIQATVPGESLPVVLADAGRLQVRVPSLHGSDRRAILTVVEANGPTFLGLDAGGVLRQQWEVVNGLATVDGIPAGLWTLQVVDAAGQRWEGTHQTPGGGSVEALLE